MLSTTLAFQTLDKQKQEDELLFQKKQLRQQEAQFLKDKAILVQQVELLKMQLNESAEREANLKKVNENIMDAFQNNQSNISLVEIEINEDHPQVAEIIRSYKSDFAQQVQSEKERNREMEYQMERQNQQLNFRVLDLQKTIEVIEKQYEYQNKEYQQLLRKYNEDIKNTEDKWRQEHSMVIKKLEGELQTINADIERQVIIRLNQKYSNDQDYNQVIIKYQKEQQAYLDEQKDFRMKVEFIEKEKARLNDKLKQTVDENGVIIHKFKLQEKKFKEEYENIKKQKEDLEKRLEMIEQSQQTKRFTGAQAQKKQMNTIGVKSRNKNNSIFNKENLLGNKSQPADLQEDEDEEKNKLRRQISLLRCQLKKLEIDIKDLKSKSNQEIASLKDKLNVERKKRMNIYEDKIDKNNQLLQDLLEKDQTIISLNRQISKISEKLQALGGRVNTPNHLLTQSMMQDSMIQPGFTNSMIDIFPNNFGNQHQSSKKFISPLRSLDLTMVNKEAVNNLNSLSFSLLPLKRDKQRRQSSLKKSVMASPTQIKRNRINSVHVGTRGSVNNLAASMNLIRLRSSKDASIAEVNEDLYKDSVESFHGHEEDFNKLDTNNIILSFDKTNQHKVKEYYTHRNHQQDDELTQALMASTSNNQKINVQNEIYLDSLDNNSVGSQDNNDNDNEDYKNFYNSYQRKNMQAHQKLQKLTQAQRNVNKNKSKKLNISKEHIQKHKAKILQNPFAEDEDCLVNILDQEDTNIEVQPTIAHSRQHLSTENLFRESQNTMETLHSYRNNNLQKQIRDVNKIKQASIPLPKPSKGSFQKGAVQKILKLKDNYEKKSQFDTRKNSLSKPSAHSGDLPQLMKSPSSPNIFTQQQKPKNSSSSSNKLGNLRLDSCPSPLDEDETVMMLGSGEKLRIKEITLQSLDPYQNQFKEQRHKFSTTINPPTAKNITRQKTDNNNAFGFRTRTNSLINSVCSEISFKMKFITNMPDEKIPKQPQTNKHSRVPSMQLSNSQVPKTFNYMKRQ